MLMFGHGRTAFAQGCFDCASCFAVIGRRERIWHVVAQRQFLGSLLRHLCFLKACNVFVLRLCCVYIAFTSKFSEFQCIREDHAWLAERNLSELFSMERGCQEYERGFKDAPMLFDCKKSTVCGEDVADHTEPPSKFFNIAGRSVKKGSDSICDCFAVDVGGDIVAVIHRGMELWGVRVFRVSGCGRDCECADCDGHQSRIVFAFVGGHHSHSGRRFEGNVHGLLDSHGYRFCRLGCLRVRCVCQGIFHRRNLRWTPADFQL